MTPWATSNLPRSWLATGSGLSNETTSYGYFTTGVLASVTYPSYGSYSSPEVNYDYDATGAMASETDWLGNTVSFAHDATGNPTAQDNDVSTSNPSGTSSTSWSIRQRRLQHLGQLDPGPDLLEAARHSPSRSRRAQARVTQMARSPRTKKVTPVLVRVKAPTSATTATT